MITIATRYNLDEAFLLRSQLEGSGIPSFIPDEFTAHNQWTFINAIGGIRIQVSPEHRETALEIISLSPDPEAESALINPLVCPHCQSSEVIPDDRRKKIALVALFLFNLPLPFARNSWFCEDCGKKFRRHDSPQ